MSRNSLTLDTQRSLPSIQSTRFSYSNRSFKGVIMYSPTCSSNSVLSSGHTKVDVRQKARASVFALICGHIIENLQSLTLNLVHLKAPLFFKSTTTIWFVSVDHTKQLYDFIKSFNFRVIYSFKAPQMFFWCPLMEMCHWKKLEASNFLCGWSWQRENTQASDNSSPHHTHTHRSNYIYHSPTKYHL